MGFIVEKQVNFPGGIDLNDFYVRIESYHLHKNVGQLDLIIGHYTNKEGADIALPPYVEDIPLNNASATLPYEFRVDEKDITTDKIISISLSGSQAETVEEIINYEKTHMVDQEITDYDDDGNEVIGTSKVMVKEPAQKVNRVLKTKVYDKDFDKENLIEFAYLKVKNIYKEKFGSENIKDLYMGRTSWGTTNLGISSKLYNSCYRSRSGTANCNLSMSNYIRKSVTPQLYDGNTGTTNSSISTYVYNQGFVYGIKLRNDSPARGTASIRASLTTVASTSSNSGEIGGTINFISNDYSFINIRFTASSGNQFDGWRTGNNSGGGTLITTSTSYNAYYTNSYIINYSTWYANTSASSPPRNSTVLGYWGPSAAGACFSYDNQTVYYSNSAPSALSSPALFRFSTGTTKSPTGYYSTGSVYRLWVSSGFWNGTINYCFF